MCQIAHIIVVLIFTFCQVDAARSEEIVVKSQNVMDISCVSNIDPIWQRIEKSDSMQGIAIGDQRMPRFKDTR